MVGNGENQVIQVLKKQRTSSENLAEKHRTKARRTLTQNSWFALIALVFAVFTTGGVGANALGASNVIDTGPTPEDQSAATAEEQSTATPGDAEEPAEEPQPLPEGTVPGTTILWGTTLVAAIVTIATGIQKLPFANVDRAKEHQTAAVDYMRAARLATEGLLANDDAERRAKLKEVNEKLSEVEQQAPPI